MSDFQRDEVLYFMISKGGRVRNHELVTHFKNFLDHPNNKAENRVLFKDYVNDLAQVRVDGGEKVLVLKKKYRPATDAFGSSASVASSTSTSSLSTTSSRSSQSKKSGASSARGSEGDLTPRKSVREDNSGGSTVSGDKMSAQNDSPRARSEPPPATAGPGGERSSTITDDTDGLGMSKVASDEQMEVRMRCTDRVAQQVGDSPSVTGSNASLASSDSQRSVTSSTSGVASLDEDANASVISVKDKIKKLNKIDSETNLGQPRHAGGGAKKGNKYGTAEDDDASHSSGMSYITLDAEQKEWMVTCSTTEYHDMNRLLSKNPNLAKLKDLTNGYTALHWAAKSGKAEVIKLIANKPGVSVDQRSHGGYTPLHLAAIHGHEQIIELLVQTFKADANLRDYSGRKAKQYLKNSASSKAQLYKCPGIVISSELLVSRRLGADQGQGKSSLDDSFIRSASMRMSNRARTMSSLLQVTSAVARQPLLRSSWTGSSEDVSEDGRRTTPTPPGSGNPSPMSARRKHSKDVDLMPPPTNAMLGRRPRYSDRSKSSSRESLTSSKSSLKNDENQNMMRSESEPNFAEGNVA